MVSFTFCSTLAHIVRRYELGDRRALNILNWPTKAHDEDFDEADLWVIFNDDVLKDIAQVRFSVSHLVCPTYLFLFLFLLFLLLFFLLLLFPFLGVIENAVFFQFPFPGAIENAVFFQFPFPGVIENVVFFQFLFFSPFPVPFADSRCFSKESALQTFFF